MNKRIFFATLLGLIGLALPVNAKDHKDCHCKPGVCKKAGCKDCKDCDCKKKPTRPAVLTAQQLQKLKKAREEYMKKVKSIVGEERFEQWLRMQRHRPSGRPGAPQRVPSKPTRPQLRKPTE